MRRSLVLFLFGIFASSSAAQDSTLFPPLMPALDLSAVDSSADACEDFYQFSCGGWHTASPMPDNVAFWSRPFTQYAHEVDDYVRAIVEIASSPDPERTPDEQMVGDYFAACMDTSAIEARGLAPLQPELALINGMNSVNELASVAGLLHKTVPYIPEHGEPLFYVFAWGDPVDGSQATRLWVSPGGMGLPGVDYYLMDDSSSIATRAAYRVHVAEILSITGMDPEVAESEAGLILDLETQLAKARLPQNVVRNDASITSNPVTPEELQELTPHFRWADFFRSHGIPEPERLNAREPASLRALDSLITTVPLDTWKAYLRWHLVAERANFLPPELRETRFDFYGRHLQGQMEEPAREQVCFTHVERDLPHALSRVFVASALHPRMQSQTHEMFEEIRGVMRRRIENADWMAAATKREAYAKLDAVRLTVGKPDVWIDDPHLVIRRDDLFGNVQRTGEALRRVRFLNMGHPLDLNDWAEPSTWMGGYYDNRRNAIVVTAAMLLYYETGFDDLAVRYGGLGAFLAHELLHGFDPLGRQYDASGRLREWWTEEDAKRFDASAQCVADQFSTYEYAPGIPVDGDFVVSEQVAELSSWDIAWEAYQNATADSSIADDEAFSPLQRFLLTNAQTWCTDATDQTWRALAAGRSSKAWAAPMVHGTVTNLSIFARGFTCRAGQAMVKKSNDICTVW